MSMLSCGLWLAGHWAEGYCLVLQAWFWIGNWCWLWMAELSWKMLLAVAD